MSKSYYTGVSIRFHDLFIAIIDDKGAVVCAASTEHYLQLKRGTGCNANPLIWVESVLKKYCNATAAFYTAEAWSKKHKNFIFFLFDTLLYQKKYSS